MNFKEEYKKEYKSIAPDQNFLNQLQQNMEHDQRSNSKRPFVLYKRIAVAAACIGVITVSLLAFPKIFSKSSDIKQDAAQLGSSTEQTTEDQSLATPGKFNSDSWFSANASESEIITLFLNKINSSELTKLYHNTDNTFTNDHLMSEAAKTELLSHLSNEAPTASPSDYSANDYYMACFSDGDIIKFTTNSDYLFLPDANVYIQLH